MAEPNQSLDARHSADDQESRIEAAASVGLNAAKGLFLYQTTMLRLWANNCELAAHNCERGLEEFSNARKQQSHQ